MTTSTSTDTNYIPPQNIRYFRTSKTSGVVRLIVIVKKSRESRVESTA